MIACSPPVLDVVELAKQRVKLREAAAAPSALDPRESAASAVGSAAPAFGIVAESAAMKRALHEARIYAPSKVPVMLVGPTGTGKTLLAEYVHGLSPRRGDPFVVVTGAELPESLAESRLFGHVRGAFTDARESRDGLITEAAGGTLFLDDMAWMPVSLQPKLLRALDTGRYRPVGASVDLRVGCRVLFGLRADPDELVARGFLLEDLRARMGESVIRLLPLAQRREDIVPLAEQFLARCPHRTGVPGGPTRFAPEVLAVLGAQPWPRNVRQLEGTIERAYLHARDIGAIELEHLPEPLDTPPRFVAHEDGAQNGLAVQYAVEVCGGRYDRAARLLGVSRNTVARYARERRKPT